MGAVVGVSAKVSRACDLSDGTIRLADIHRYEATSIGRKELKIKHLL
jgi:hypothetical protein